MKSKQPPFFHSETEGLKFEPTLVVKASVTPEPNQLRIHFNFRIRMDSGAFGSPSSNGRNFVRDSETFVEEFGLF